MKNVLLFAAFFFVCSVIILVHSASARISFFDNKVNVDGYIQNQTSYRISSDNHEFVSSENRLQVEMSAGINDNLSLHGVYRGLYDAIYDLRHDSDHWSRLYSGSRDSLCIESKMREYYADITLWEVDLRIGKQQVVWGESDGLRLMDIVNPLDMRRQYITRDWEDIRIGQHMVKAVYGIDPLNNSFLELVWNLGDIERDKIYSDTTMSDRHKSPWTISNSLALESLVPLRTNGWVDMPEDSASDWSFSDSEVGGRIGGNLGNWFVTLNCWYSFSDTPVLEGDLTTLEPFLLGIGPPPPLPVHLTYKYPRETVIGFTFNKPTGLWVWRGEFATYLDKHYNKTEIGLFLPNIKIVKKVQQASMLGFDYKNLFKWLNPEKMIFISGQVFYHHIFNYDKELQFGPYSQTPREDSFVLSFLANTGYDMERICPEVLVVYDTANTGLYIKSIVELKYGDYWRPQLGALLFFGDQQELPFGEMRKNDEIYLRIKYQF